MRMSYDTEEATEPPDACTDEARGQGCSCRMQIAHSASIDPPEPITDPWCPVHGWRDPDRERDEARDRAMEPTDRDDDGDF